MVSVREAELFFDRSLAGVTPGVVTLNGCGYDFWRWTNEKLASKLIGLDTKTEVIEGPEIPRLAVATAFDGETCFLIHPTDLGSFIRKHTTANYVGHNIGGFDYYFVRQHLQQIGDREAADIWFQVADEGRMACTMLADQLVRLAYGSGYPRPRDLATVAKRWAKIEDVDKDDPYRKRFGEIIDLD